MDIKEFQKRLNSFDEALRDQFIKSEVNSAGLRLISKTKKRTPVDTGLLKRSWWVTQPRKVSRGYEITIKNPIHYATYVECGHLLRNGKWYPPRFMLKRSMNEIENELPIELDRGIVELWNNAMERDAAHRANNNVYGE